MTARPETRLPAIESTSLADQAHVIIRERILSGQLAGGSALKDSVLATQLGVSRAPVRQALERLVQSGLATKLPNRPYRVVTVDAEVLSELQLMRFADEVAAIIHLVAHSTVLDPLQDHLTALERAVEHGDWRVIVDADLAFHREVVRLTGLPRLLGRFDEICDQVRTWLGQVDVPRMIIDTQVQRHEELLEALLAAQSAHDPRHAMALWEAHILGDHRSALVR